jgi:prophage regulatory protein
MEPKQVRPQRIMRKPEILNATGLSDTTIWRMEQEGRFPKRVRLGGNSCGWFETEYEEWLTAISEAR